MDSPSTPTSSGRDAPRLEVRWGGGWEEFVETVAAVREPMAELPETLPPAFRDAAVGRHVPQRSVGISATLHLLLIVLPVPAFLTQAPPRSTAELPKIEFDLQWAGTSPVLPPISPPRAPKRKPSPGGKPNEPLPPLGAERQQPQTIVSTPADPNHPTHTVIRQNALEGRLTPRELKLPNMVIPPAPNPVEMSELDLRRMRVPGAPLDLSGPPQAPQRRLRRAEELKLAPTDPKNLYARLVVPPGSEGTGTGAAPEVEAALGTPRSGDLDLPGVIALSAQPAAPAPSIALPEANLRARFVAGPYAGEGSPGGIPGGVPGASGGEGGGPGGILGGAGASIEVPDLLVLPAGPVPPGPVVVGPGAGGPPRPSAPGATGLESRRAAIQAAREQQPQARAQASEPSKPARERADELIEGLSPSRRGGGDYRGRRIYTIYINMPNLTSQSGSWVLRFAELGDEGPYGGGASDTGLIESPVAVQKVDPGYPAEARRDKIEGTVFLYGVIRPDGSVDNVEVVRSLHASLDQRAVAAFQRWRFDPGRKNGAPIPLEVVVEIPFRLTELF
jgi:TonB family protein